MDSTPCLHGVRGALDKLMSATRFAARGLVVSAALGFVASAFAHQGLDEQLTVIEAQLKEEPGNPALHVQVGDLHRMRREWDAALAAYERAAGSPGGIEDADFMRGRLFLEARWPTTAKLYLDRFLATQPDHAGALVARGRASASLGLPLPAAVDLGRAIAVMPAPKPEHYLERAQALTAAGREVEALRGLDEGLTRLGPVAGLQLAAVDLEIALGHHEAALVRVDRLLARAPERATWLIRRGEILEHAGRYDEARAAYARAEHALASYPEPRRHSRAARDLQQTVRDALRRVQGPEKERSGEEQERSGEEMDRPTAPGVEPALPGDPPG